MALYMRPEALFQPVTAYEPSDVSRSSRGRIKPTEAQESTTISCAIAESKQSEIDKYRQFDLKITHTLVQQGAKIADREWLLQHVSSGRTFRVKAVDSPGAVDAYTIYYCEEVTGNGWIQADGTGEQNLSSD